MESFSDTTALFEEELNKSPRIVHLAGRRKLWTFIPMILLSVAFIAGVILLNDGSISQTVFPLVTLGLIWLSIVPIFELLFKKSTVWFLFPVIIIAVAVNIILSPTFLNIALAVFAVWVIICMIITKSAFEKSAERSKILYNLKVEEQRRVVEHSYDTTDELERYRRMKKEAEEAEKPKQEIIYCPTCGFSLLPGETICTRCHPEAAPAPEPKADIAPKTDESSPFNAAPAPQGTPEPERKSSTPSVAPSMFSTTKDPNNSPFRRQ